MGLGLNYFTSECENMTEFTMYIMTIAVVDYADVLRR